MILIYPISCLLFTGDKVEVKTISFDYSKTDGFDKLASELKDLDIGLLGR